MYNESNKTRYLSQTFSSDNLQYMVVKNIFEIMEVFEELYDKDLYDFNASEIENAYKTMSLNSITRLRNINSRLLQYTQWCQKESLVNDGINHYEEFYGDRMYNYIDRTYIENGLISRENLLNIASEMINSMDAFAMIALYEGFGGVGREDFEYAMIKHIDGNHIHLRNRTIEVSPEFIKYANKASAQIVYQSRKSERYDTLLDENCELIYKQAINKRSDPTNRIVEYRLKRELSYLGYDDISVRDIVKSGRVQYLKAEASKKGIDPKELCLQYKQDISRQFGLDVNYIPVVYQELKPFLV